MNHDDFQIAVGDNFVSVSELTEVQAKDALCKLMDHLEKHETRLRSGFDDFQRWRDVRVKKVPRLHKKAAP